MGRIPFGVKLIATLAIVVLVSAVVGYFWIERRVEQGFQHFSSRSRILQARQITDFLANYYERRGSWQGVEEFLQRGTRTLQGELRRRVILLDEKNTVVATVDPALMGATLPLPPEAIRAGLPIDVQGQRVGLLLLLPPPHPGPVFSLLEVEFLGSLRQAVLVGALAAGGIALVLGLFLLYELVLPLRRLTAAANQIASGRLDQRVEVRSRDVIGKFAKAFNDMAESLSRSERARRNMIADLAHELSTPLGAVQAGLEAFLDGVMPPSPENLGALHNKTLLLNRLVDDLRELSLAEAGELKLKKQLTDVESVIAPLAQALRPQLDEQKVQLTVEVGEKLPPIQADAQRLQQVLLNLLSNAVRYTPGGGQIRIVASKAADGLRISVIDTGPGIPPDALPHIFERFYRGDPSRSRSSGGNGLGLAIAKQLVEAHGGKIWAESADGRGATFTIALPV